MSTFEFVVTCLGLGAVTLITRGFFVISNREIPLPAWVQQGLRYAPMAALVAVVAPEIMLNQGQLISTWREPKVFAAVAACVYYFWRRGILGTIIIGLTVFLALRLGLGW